MGLSKWCTDSFSGIGSTLGTGIYIVAGQVAKQTAGPAVVLSFFVAGVASAFAGEFIDIIVYTKKHTDFK